MQLNSRGGVWEIFNWIHAVSSSLGEHLGLYQVLDEALSDVSHLLLNTSLRGRYYLSHFVGEQTLQRS